MREFTIHDGYVTEHDGKLDQEKLFAFTTRGMHVNFHIRTDSEYCAEFLKKFERLGTVNIKYYGYNPHNLLQCISCCVLGVVIMVGLPESFKNQLFQVSQYRVDHLIVLQYKKAGRLSLGENVKEQGGYKHFYNYMLF